MGDKIEINDQVDWAIIQSFYRAEKHILMLKKIVSIVRESSNKKDKTIEARIRNLVEKNYLIKCDTNEAKEDHHSNGTGDVKRRSGLYGLNEKLEFEFTGIPLTSKADIAEVPDAIRRNHTNDLKEAIENWIKYFPEPTSDYSVSKKALIDSATNLDESSNPKKHDPYSDNIAECEKHLLFSDLCNHLPCIDCDACTIWEKYKKELYELNAMQDALLGSIAAEVDRWLCNNVAFYKYEIPRSGGYDLAYCIYPLMTKYVSGDRSEIEFILSATSCNLIIKRSSLDPKLIMNCINEPRKFQSVERQELNAFAMIIDRILGKKRIIGSAEKIVVKTRELELLKFSMIKELEKALLYTSYPGGCQFLK
jgi:hypothetical protein